MHCAVIKSNELFLKKQIADDLMKEKRKRGILHGYES